MARLTVVHDSRMLLHKNAEQHPECPERLTTIEQRIRYAGLPQLEWSSPSPATRKDILRVHTPEHLSFIDSLRGKVGMIGGDTGVSRGSIDAAYLSAGSAIRAVESVFRGESDHALSLGRPPGHHAERNKFMGFCLFNNIAIATRWAIERYNLQRVLIIDWDVHHGNGTHDIFYDDPRVLFVSTHQSPLFPGTGDWNEQGAENARGKTLNIPFPAGTTDGDISHIFREIIQPIAQSWEPELIMISAGFDAHRDDPLAETSWTSRGFAELTSIVKNTAEEVADGRLVLSLEGGYDLHALSESVLACCRILTGGQQPKPNTNYDMGRQIVNEARRHFRWRWPMI